MGRDIKKGLSIGVKSNRQLSLGTGISAPETKEKETNSGWLNGDYYWFAKHLSELEEEDLFLLESFQIDLTPINNNYYNPLSRSCIITASGVFMFYTKYSTITDIYCMILKKKKIDIIFVL